MATKTRPAKKPGFRYSSCARKRRYGSRGECNCAVARLRRVKGASYDPCRPYRCKFCGGWHLTHKDGGMALR